MATIVNEHGTLPAHSEETIPPQGGVGSFGSVVFQVSAEVLYLVSNISRSTAARVEEHQVVGAKPRLEFIAPELDGVSFDIFLHAGHGVNPLEEIKRLRTLCTEGRVQRLILGGSNLGHYLLLDITENWLRNGPGGVVLVASAALNLKEYW